MQNLTKYYYYSPSVEIVQETFLLFLTCVGSIRKLFSIFVFRNYTHVYKNPKHLHMSKNGKNFFRHYGSME